MFRRRLVPAILAVAVLAGAAVATYALEADAAGGTPAVAFVQQVNKRAVTAALALTPANPVTAGNRMIVEVGVWSSAKATASGVTDSAGNTYTKLTAIKASDNTELSIWSAPITAGDGTSPTITVAATGKADVGATALEYSGLSTATGTAAVDQQTTATATTSAAANVSAGPTAPTTAGGELALGFYADSGFNRTLAGDPTYTVRANVSPVNDMEMLAQDTVLGGAGATPNPTTTTGAKTPWLAANVVFKTAAPAPPPTAPAVPAKPTATAGDGRATVRWTAPSDGGSQITKYTVTPYTGGQAGTPTVVTGTPAATSATVTGLTNGSAYTFTVSATNAVGTSDASAASDPVTPDPAAAPGVAFVQQVNKRGLTAGLTLTPANPITAGNRMIVQVGVWSSAKATASGVTDSAGNTYTKLTAIKASDSTELSIWSAPITAGDGTRPTITVATTGAADVGATALEYSGLSTASGTAAVDQQTTATGMTGGASAQVAPGPTAPTAAAGELSLGFYADSGFNRTLSGDPDYTVRANVSPANDMELLAEDTLLGAAGATPNPKITTGANTPWLAAGVVLKPAGQNAGPTAPSAPGAVAATAGDGQATVSWTAPSDGGSPITKYTVTPYVGPDAQTPTVVTGTPPVTTATVTGLTNGTAYTFTVSATNAVGTGPASAGSAAVTPGTPPAGEWSSLMNWPIVAVHSMLLPTGNVLAFDGWQQPQPTTVWNPTTQTFPTTLNAPGSIFCAGNAFLPDGRVITAGGDGMFTTGQLGLATTAIFDPTTSTWTKAHDMNRPRWYPSLTELADGRYVAISGNSTGQTTWADTPEVYDPAKDSWTLLDQVSTPQVHEAEYPFSYLVPGGKVFTIGPSEDNSFLLDVDKQTWTPTGGASGVVNGSSVMYRPGKILYTGGAPSVTRTTNSAANAAVIDLNAATPNWRSVAPMQHARVYHTLTMLADGTVLAVGGEGTSDQSVVTSGVLPAEIWDPATETWSSAPPMAAARNYHSTAVLMPDGRVLVAGGGHYQGGSGAGQYSAQFYSPSYLFKGARPTVTAAPSGTTYGSDIAVSTPDAASIKSVNLVSLAADTHQSDMNQHFVPLDFTTGPDGLTIKAPADASLAPPGTYMLFIVNDKGVPSVARMITVAPKLTAPSAPAKPTATAGDGRATVRWNAPADGGSQITKYTVTPYTGGQAGTPTVVTGTPAATSTTVTGLTNGTDYTFTVSATNAIGTSDESPASDPVTPAPAGPSAPAFVQQIAKRGTGASLAVTPANAITAGDRMIVEASVWSYGKATASGVTDSAGNTYTKLTSIKATDNTELSIWSAPITAGDGTRPAITVTATGNADVGATALEYSGLSTAAGTAAVDQQATATGTTTSATAVGSGATAATTAAGELALGFYADSGFNAALAGDAAYTVRSNVSPTNDMEMLVQDRLLGAAGATPNATVTTGARVPWLAATIAFKTASGGTTALTAAPAQGASTLVYASDVVSSLNPLGTRNVFLCPLGPQAKGGLLRRLAALA